MMKKYNLYLKEEHRGTGAIKYPEITGQSELGRFKQFYILAGKFLEMDLRSDLKHEAVVFTQQEIDNLPHGFVKLFDLIEVAEELYYIRFPYACDKFLNEDLRDGQVKIFGRAETSCFKTKFTMSEIEEKYSSLQSFAVKVEEIDNE